MLGTGCERAFDAERVRQRRDTVEAHGHTEPCEGNVERLLDRVAERHVAVKLAIVVPGLPHDAARHRNASGASSSRDASVNAGRRPCVAAIAASSTIGLKVLPGWRSAVTARL